MARSDRGAGDGLGSDPATADSSADGVEPYSDYEVGYGKPPSHTRWGKGQSGNPRGRPRKSDKRPFSQRAHPVRDMILDEAERAVEVNQGGRAIELEMLRGITRSVFVGAMKGNRHQQKMAFELAFAAEKARASEIEESISLVRNYKLKWSQIFELAAELGKSEPRQLPHPDHVHIDPITCAIMFSGPFDKDEKRFWDHLKFQLRETSQILQNFAAEASRNPRCKSAADRVALTQEHMARLEKIVPAGWDWREELGWEQAYAEKVLAQEKGRKSDTC